ncbi:hypothetical protein ACFLSG_00955 [Candidatus Bipolaricaulota bacterium]
MTSKSSSWRVLVVGLGDIGAHILEVLARTPNIESVVAVDVSDSDEKLRMVYSAELGALHHGSQTSMSFQQLDVSDVSRTAELIRSTNPDVILSSTSLLSWWVPQSQLPDDVFRRIDEAGFGPWYPLHFMLLYKLMLAIQESDVSPIVVNCSYPDATNAALGKIGLAPTLGVGNCDLFYPEFKWMTARHIGGSPLDVDAYFVGDHYMAHVLNQFQSTHDAPYFLKLVYQGKDVTEEIAAKYGGLGNTVVAANRYMPKGAADHFLVAASAVKNAVGILGGSEQLAYSPGPCGLPGGYPIRLLDGKVDVALPDELSLDQAIKINQESGQGDGVELIRDDGTLVLTESAHSVMREELSFNIREFVPERCVEDARELLDRFKILVGKHQ